MANKNIIWLVLGILIIVYFLLPTSTEYIMQDNEVKLIKRNVFSSTLFSMFSMQKPASFDIEMTDKAKCSVAIKHYFEEQGLEDVDFDKTKWWGGECCYKIEDTGEKGCI